MMQGVVNVVMGNAPDIGDALIASPQVLSPIELRSNYPLTVTEHLRKKLSFSIGKKDYIHWLNGCWKEIDGRFC